MPPMPSSGGCRSRRASTLGIAVVSPAVISGINTTIVNPGFFRTELLVKGASTIWPGLSIDDYDQRIQGTIEAVKGMNGKQGGDPAKLAAALIAITSEEQPPLRFLAGADAVQTAEDKAHLLLERANAYRELSSSLAHDDVLTDQ